jgi:hypothetical protein
MFSYRNIHAIKKYLRQKDSQDAKRGIHIVVTQLIHNNCLSFRQLKCGESHMTYLARNTVKGRGASWAKTALLLSYVFTATYISHMEHIKLSIVAINVRNWFILQFA